MTDSKREETTVVRKGNVIWFYDLKHYRRVGDFVSRMFDARKESSFDTFVLDFRDVGTAFPNVCVPLAALIRYYRDTGLKMEVLHSSTIPWIDHLDAPILATEMKLEDASSFLSRIWEFSDGKMVYGLVDKFVRFVSELIECEPGVLQAFEWCLNEVMDNVLRHSGTASGFVMAQLHRSSRRIVICIADAGIGIYRSLRTRYSLTNAVAAIQLALEEGVTRDQDIGHGNGLWGLMQIVERNTGILGITSGAGAVRFESGGSVCNDRVPYPDWDHQCTILDFQIDAARPINLREAFGGYEPANLCLERIETDSGEHSVNVLEAASGTGTRSSGNKLYNVVLNLLNQGAAKIILDFSDARIVSSSFADEGVAKLAEKMGREAFARHIRTHGANESTRFILDQCVQRRIGSDAHPLGE